MDLDRLTLTQARLMSKIIELLGVPASTDQLGDCIATLEGTLTMYRKELATIREATRGHE